MVTDRVSTGIDPLYVGELVREGIEQDWPYIFTDNEFESLVDERFATIKQGLTAFAGENRGTELGPELDAAEERGRGQVLPLRGRATVRPLGRSIPRPESALPW